MNFGKREMLLNILIFLLENDMIFDVRLGIQEMHLL